MRLDPKLDAQIFKEGKCRGCGEKRIMVSSWGGFCASCRGSVTVDAAYVDTAEAARRELARRELARRRFLPFILRVKPDYKAGWFHRDLAARLERFVRRVERGESPKMIINAPPRHGKLCADSTPVLTTEGWKTHGELRPGDYVFHPSGRPVRVLEVHPPAVASVEVEISNGEVIKCHPAHEWVVKCVTGRKRGWRTVETRWFMTPLDVAARGSDSDGGS